VLRVPAGKPGGTYVGGFLALTRGEEDALRHELSEAGRRGGRAGADVLLERWVRDPDPDLRLAALANLPFAGTPGGAPERSAVAAIEEARKDRDPRVRARAEWALQQLARPD
jgi:hypothetical protein